jgi:hypothetical protein
MTPYDIIKLADQNCELDKDTRCTTGNATQVRWRAPHLSNSRKYLGSRLTKRRAEHWRAMVSSPWHCTRTGMDRRRHRAWWSGSDFPGCRARQQAHDDRKAASKFPHGSSILINPPLGTAHTQQHPSDRPRLLKADTTSTWTRDPELNSVDRHSTANPTLPWTRSQVAISRQPDWFRTAADHASLRQYPKRESDTVIGKS